MDNTGLVITLPDDFIPYVDSCSTYGVTAAEACSLFYNAWYSQEACATVDEDNPYWLAVVADLLVQRYPNPTAVFLWGILIIYHLSFSEYFHRVTDWRYSGDVTAVPTGADHFTLIHKGKVTNGQSTFSYTP